jgi:2,6-dihydroxypyridine 3-monooxygenase
MQDLHVAWARRYAAATFPPAIAEVVTRTVDPFVQVVLDVAVRGMAFGRVCLIGDAAILVRPHAGAGTAKACSDAWALGDALHEAGGDPQAALAAWAPRQLAVGRALMERARWMGDGSQFRHDWTPGDPRLRFGLYQAGDSVFDTP